MCTPTLKLYDPGTRVWVKLVNRVWWPGEVVDPSNLPGEVKDYMRMKKDPIAVTFFNNDNIYEVVNDHNSITPYNCSRKMAFIKKGHSMYTRQKRCGVSCLNFDMSSFLQDVITSEKAIGGDPEIFNQFEVKHSE